MLRINQGTDLVRLTVVLSVLLPFSAIAEISMAPIRFKGQIIWIR